MDAAIWSTWWVWIAAGLVLAILEVLLPGFIFLGFAVAALLVGLLLASGLLPASGAWILVVFAVLALAAFIGLRRSFQSGRGQVKIINRDINDN